MHLEMEMGMARLGVLICSISPAWFIIICSILFFLCLLKMRLPGKYKTKACIESPEGSIRFRRWNGCASAAENHPRPAFERPGSSIHYWSKSRNLCRPACEFRNGACIDFDFWNNNVLNFPRVQYPGAVENRPKRCAGLWSVRGPLVHIYIYIALLSINVKIYFIKYIGFGLMGYIYIYIYIYISLSLSLSLSIELFNH